VLSDLSALTPPFLMCAAFLVAVGAFLRHEMRSGKNRADEQGNDVDEPNRDAEISDPGSGPSR
jgi:hypothetical protein